jgi:hypothetical protein
MTAGILEIKFQFANGQSVLSFHDRTKVLLFSRFVFSLFFFVVPSSVFSPMDQVRFPFPPMGTDKSASLFLNFVEIDEVDGPN